MYRMYRMYRMYGIRTTHMYRMYGIRAMHMYRMYGIRAMQELLPRSYCRGAVFEEPLPKGYSRDEEISLWLSKVASDYKLPPGSLPFALYAMCSVLLLVKLVPQ